MSIDTSNRYSSIISIFYRYLSTLEKYASVPVASYHSIVDNHDLKEWQIQREIDRVTTQSARPSTETIIEDGKRIYSFFEWLQKKAYPSCVSFQYKTWQPNFKDEELLSHIKRKALTVLDGRGVKALDREVYQSRSYTLPTNHEMKSLISSYEDPVYAAMFKLSLGTAMRPMDLCKFPYLGNGRNTHIMPYESMSMDGTTVEYHLSRSKGDKSRTIAIHKLDLKALDDHYIQKCYAPRAELYEKRFGKPCPPSILFLSSRGVPVTPKMISRRTVAARERARKDDPSIRKSVRFYDARHWWPTIFLIQRFKHGLKGQISEVRDAAAMQVIKNQMGHAHLITTYNHYLDLARVVLLAHEGFVNEVATNPSKTIEEFLESPTLL
jgi:integrase